MTPSFLVLLFLTFVSSTPTNRTLVMVKYGGKALDSRQLPNMMAKAFGTSRRLTDEDRIYENCLLEDGMVEDLSAIGVQIISSKCQATSAQISSYMKKAHDALDIVSLVEPEREVSYYKAPAHASLRRAQSDCGPNDSLGTDDPLSSCQPGLELIDVTGAWEELSSRNQTTPLEEVVVAVLDTGIDLEHPDLVNQLWQNPEDGSVGYNFVTNTTDPTDDEGHGTHCAGIIAAENNNGVGIASVAGGFDVKIMSLKFLGGAGTGSAADALRALNFALEHGAQVSSHSYGSSVGSEIEREAFANAAATGHVIIVAAGNDGLSVDEFPTYPCVYATDIPSMLCVGGTTPGPTTPVTRYPDTNYGSAVTIAAPGVRILSAIPGDYLYANGTSMATPHVSGVAALLVSLGLEGQDVTDAILQGSVEGAVSDLDIPLLNAAQSIQSV